MSDYESHTGKLRKVLPQENETFEQLCKRLWIAEALKGDEYTEDDYKEGALFSDFYEKFINQNDEFVWEVFDHKELGDEDDSFCRINDNKDGTYSFHTRFYNGGTCMSEMLEDEIKNIV
jgi:hypothetical protein